MYFFLLEGRVRWNIFFASLRICFHSVELKQVWLYSHLIANFHCFSFFLFFLVLYVVY